MRVNTLAIVCVVLSSLVAPTSSRAQIASPDEQGAPQVLRYPACVYCPDPAMTREARAQHVQGFVALEVTITERGTLERIAIFRSLDYGLTERAIQAVRRWRISPAIGVDGKPMPLRIGILVRFGFGNAAGGFATG